MAGNLKLLMAVAATAAVAALGAQSAQSQIDADCGDPFQNAYGPFDYRSASPDQKQIVEVNHFTPAVESLHSGITGSLGAEIDYTLRAFPNHPRALMAMIRLGQRDRTNKPQGAHYTIDCYVDRAIRFRPDDTKARQIRGIYFSNQRRYNEAIADFSAVVQQQPDNANAHYNLGLAYFEAKDYARARDEAKLARDLGFPLEGLKGKLKSAGKWTD
jgi:tetratricopeptide (TPR) repeat protein